MSAMGSRLLPAAPDSNHQTGDIDLPPGFRFHPTDEELVVYYLSKKVVNGRFPAFVISEVDLNKCEPWDLPAKAKMGEKEWYFFSLRDRKYPTGMRTNRATEAGYWKATGKDREVMSSTRGELVGMKKTLVFYRGRAPKGEKTNWIMHEYRIEGDPTPRIHTSKVSKDEWVVCRIFQKSSSGGKKIPTECNPNGSNLYRNSTTFNPEMRSSLPALLESPNPNSVDDSDCLIENSFHGGVQDAMRSTNSWGGMKTEMGATLDDLHQGKNSLLRCPSLLMDLYASVPDIAAPTPSGLKIDNGAYTRMLRQDSNMNFNLHQAQAQLMSLKYLEQQPTSRGMSNSNLRACKSEPYAGEDDEAQSSASQRSSLMDSWVVADSSGGFSSEAALPSMTTESSVTDLDNNNTNNTATNSNGNNPYYRYNGRLSSGAFIADHTNTAGGELTECLWGY